MRELTFQPIDENNVDTFAHRAAWDLALTMVRNHPVGDEGQTAAGGRLIEALRGLATKEARRADGEIIGVQYKYRPEGGTIRIEEASFDLLKKALKWWRHLSVDGKHAITLDDYEALECLDAMIAEAQRCPLNADGEPLKGAAHTKAKGEKKK